MAKEKTIFFCTNCGYESAKWLGKCPACNSWNTFTEEKFTKSKSSGTNWKPARKERGEVRKISEITSEDKPRISTTNSELDRVLGGGLVPGGVTLMAGEPGIGKSTLLLQVALQMPCKILYVSGEESAHQIRLRADRMNAHDEADCLVFSETNVDHIIEELDASSPDVLIIDSIQTLQSPDLESAAGSVSQVRQCTADLISAAKSRHLPVFLVGHITKDGTIAGPKVLEHMVDTVLQFEGDRHLSYRMLRTTKNRFGSTSELGIYEMRSDGLHEVKNPSEILITQREGDLSGVAIGATMEGNRPLLIEIQALVSTAAYGTPQRTPTGFDNRRLNMLLAVLEKRCGFRFAASDVFLNIAGGLRVEDPAMDLAACAAMVSSLEDIPVDDKTVFAAEVGLGGELRAVQRTEQRIAEAEKLGFERIVVSKFGLKGTDINKFNITVNSLSHLNEV
ncbi:MAG: DNA repair protein RadA, partial [Cyclobacteriaceae bacterium]